jgi:transcriptional regulator
MHPNPAFRKTPAQDNLAFARNRGFGILAGNGPHGPLLAHIPFLLSADGSFADLHLARSNPVIPVIPGPAVLSVVGADGYVSPDWYGLEDQVPTWNYVAVHLRGTLTPLPPEYLRPHLDALSDHHEARLAPKPVWKSTKMTDGTMDRLMRMILPFRLNIATVDGTWKLGQNKPASARQGVIDALDGHPIAALMRALPPE